MITNLPITHIIHNNNHTQTNRVCTINIRRHNATYIEFDNNAGGIVLNDVKPGLYYTIINEVEYFFDLYITVNRFGSLIINNPYWAYAYVNDKRYPIILYRNVITNNGNEITLQGTVSNKLDMIVIDGKTITLPNKKSDISEIMASIPNNGIIKSSTFHSQWVGSLEDLQTDNDVWDNIELMDMEYYENSSNNIRPYEIRSISGFKIITNNSAIINENDYLDILLKNNIKSLPNGTKDTFILNMYQQQHHLIYRIGRRIFTGNESWEYLEIGSNSQYYLFYLKDNNVKLQNSNTNMICSHFDCVQCSLLINSTTNKSGICSSYGNMNNGFIIKIPAQYLDSQIASNSKISAFKNWLSNELKNEDPFIVEYELSSIKYKTVLLDEYHIDTYYPNTFIKVNNDDYDVSYFYKSLTSV